MADATRIGNRLLGIVVALLAIAGLRWIYPDSMPLAAAVFVVAAIWPVTPWLDRRLPAWRGTPLTALVLLLALLGVCGAIHLSAAQVVQSLLERPDAFLALHDALQAFAPGLSVSWGALNFLLNVIPVFGNVIGIVPPTLHAAVQFRDWQMPVVTCLGDAVPQTAIGNLVDPGVQGETLSVSTTAVMVALALRGWLRGIAGALLAMPLTAATAIFCGSVRSTARIARLLSRDGRGGTRAAGAAYRPSVRSSLDA